MSALPIEAEEYLVWLTVERGRAPTTVAAYRRDLGAYLEFLTGAGKDLTDAGPDEVRDFISSQRQRGLAPSTVKRRVVAVRNLHRFLVDDERLAQDPSAEVELPGVPRGIPKALSEAEVSRLLAAVAGDEPAARRDRAILEVLYGTGVRISELVGLSLSDLDLNAGRMRVLGKGAKERVVPIGRLAGLALEEWLCDAGRGALVPGQWRRRHDSEALLLNARGGRLSRQGAWGVVRKYGSLVGLDGKLSPHVLRHSCATHMIDHGADLRIVQELLGHASVSTTQIYTAVSTERLWSVYDEAHPRARRRNF